MPSILHPYTNVRTEQASGCTASATIQRVASWPIESWAVEKPQPFDAIAYAARHGYMPAREYKRSGEVKGVTQGELTTNHKSKVQISPEKWCYRTVRYITDFRIPHGNPSGTTPSHPTSSKTDPIWKSLRSQAILKLHEKTQDTQMALAESVGTLSQTRDMVTKAAETLFQAARLVRRKRFRDAARRLGIPTPEGVSPRRDFHGNWLEYRYGWLPLVQDAYGAMVVCYDAMRDHPPIRVVNASVVSRTSPKTTTWSENPAYLDSTNGLVNPGAIYATRTSWQVSSTLVCKTGWVVRYDNAAFNTLERMGVVNPALVAWELTPFSFVVDWFVDVSGALTQLSTFVGRECLAHYVTYYYVSRIGMEATVTNGPAASSGTTWSAAPARGFSQRYWMDRDVLTNPSYTGLTLASGLNLTRFFDALALGASFVRLR